MVLLKNQYCGQYPGARHLGDSELNAVQRVIRSQSLSRFYGLNLGNKVRKLEEKCCHFFDRRFALALSSGTAALQTALHALGVSEGDEIILPAYGWSANLMSVLILKAIPVIVPIDEKLGLDINILEKSISKKTRAIVAIHMRGTPCKIKVIEKIARNLNLGLIEDGAQCMGGEIEGNPIGSWGDISILSFQYNKLLTCGEGGVLLTNREDLFKKAYYFHDLGMMRYESKSDPLGLNAIKSIGVNYRFNELQAAILLGQLRKKNKILKNLKKNYHLLLQECEPLITRYNLEAFQFSEKESPNYAYLCFRAGTYQKAHEAMRAFHKSRIPVQYCGSFDPHHCKVWVHFMKKSGYKYKLVKEDQSLERLGKTFFIEINSSL